MSELHLLDILAARHGCFISDLNLTPFLRRAALSDLCGMDENSYPLSQWQDVVRYLTGDERDFASIKEVKDFILNETEVRWITERTRDISLRIPAMWATASLCWASI